jgi:hypothetical protein
MLCERIRAHPPDGPCTRVHTGLAGGEAEGEREGGPGSGRGRGEMVMQLQLAGLRCRPGCLAAESSVPVKGVEDGEDGPNPKENAEGNFQRRLHRWIDAIPSPVATTCDVDEIASPALPRPIS